MVLQCIMNKYAPVLIFLSLVLGIISCSKEVEKIPLELDTIDYIFDVDDSLGVNAERFMSGIYNALPKGYNRVGGDILDAASDDAISSQNGSTDVLRLATGGYTSLTFPSDENFWSKGYAGIRKANIFINNIDIVPLNKMVTSGFPMKSAYKAEAKFIRALLYFELLKRYGGVPIVGNNVGVLGEDIELPRETFANTVDYILGELDNIKDSLRTKAQTKTTGDYGAVTRGACMALKARVLLYAASPLYNGGNIEAANELTGYLDFDAGRWRRAADAAKELIDMNQYSLVEGDINKVFTTIEGVDGNKNDEIIFVREEGKGKGVEVANAPVGFSPGTANGRTSPTQELIDAFPMKNGLSIDELGSGYDVGDPYKDRDPRLSMTVLYNGHQWLNTTLETFEGGKSHPGNLNVETRTSYYMRKFMGPFETTNDFSDVFHDVVLFRYAEVLLNYAEALNESIGAVNEVYDALKKIRARAGVEEGGDGMYGITLNMDKDEMRKFIHNEKRIEFAFEEQRFWDIRRWKEAENVMNGQLHGMSIVKSSSGRISYSLVPVLNPVFQTRQYFYPIPYDEVVKNDNMTQNPGW